QKQGNLKIPVYIYLKSRRPFGFAGLMSLWTSPEGKRVCTCSIITTSANKLLGPVHDRMPVIIARKDEDIWIDPSTKDKDKLLSLLRPYDPEEMDYYRVPSLVNSPSHNAPDCIRRV
ncbi:MAG: SOS response-associated peptidase, partial [Nitrospirota bacterium]